MFLQFSYSLIIIFLNSVTVRIFLYALGSNKYSKKIKNDFTPEFLIKKITGIVYWKERSAFLKIQVIILVASYFFILYCLTTFILSVAGMLNDARWISIPLKFFCVVVIVNFFSTVY